MLALLAEAAPQPPTPNTPIWLTVLIAVITVLGGSLGWNIWKRMTHGKTDDALQISRAAIEQAQNAKELFVEYRVELEAAQKQIATYLDQLIQVNRLLGEANARIQRLEDELRIAKGEHEDLRQALRKAQQDKEKADKAREEILKQMEQLRDHIRELETGTNSKPSDEIGKEVI